MDETFDISSDSFLCAKREVSMFTVAQLQGNLTTEAKSMLSMHFLLLNLLVYAATGSGSKELCAAGSNSPDCSEHR